MTWPCPHEKARAVCHDCGATVSAASSVSAGVGQVPADTIENLRAVAAAAWGYRVFYEAYWGENVPGSALSVERKQVMLATLVFWQQELDAALAAMDDNKGDFAAAIQAHRATVAAALAAVRTPEEQTERKQNEKK